MHDSSGVGLGDPRDEAERVRRMPPAHGRTLGTGATVALVLAALLVRVPALWLVPSCDEAIFATVGNVWLNHGGMPYVDALENKPPGVYLVYGLCIKAIDSPFSAPRAIAALCAALTALLIGVAGAHFHSRAAGVVGGLAFAGLSAAAYTPMAYSEAFMLPLSFGAVWLCYLSCRDESGWARRAVLAGLCAGFALLFKQVAVAALAAMVLGALLAPRHRFRRIALICVGLAAPVALCVAYFAAQGHLAALLDGVVGIVLSGPTIRVAGGQHIWLKEAAKFLAPAAPFILASAWVLLLGARDWPRPARVLLSVWFALCMLAAVGALRFAANQLLQPLPVACLLGSMGLVGLWNGTVGRLRSGLKAVAVAALVVVFLAVGALQWPRYSRVIRSAVRASSQLDDNEIAAAYIRDHTSPNERIYVADLDSHIYVYADRVPAHRAFNVIFTPVERHRRDLLRTLRLNPPAYIAMQPVRLGGARLSREELDEAMGDRYRQVLEDRLGSLVLYERDPDHG